MTDLVPSFILKADRAEKHLGDLKVEVARWADTHPYEVRATHQRHGDVYHLRFTSSPPPQLGTIAADFVYNIRSGLDHLMGALVPSAQRDSVYFPVYFVGVWEDPVPGEHVERTKARRRWQSDTAKVRPEAVAILKSLQPPDGAGKDLQRIGTFRAINHLSNKDKHRRLPVTFSGLAGTRLIFNDASGKPQIAPPDRGVPDLDRAIAKDGTELGVPEGAVDVKIAGAPVVAIEISPDEGNIQIPEAFDLALRVFRERAIQPLAPFVHPGGHRTRP